MGRGEITCTESDRSQNLEDLLVRLDLLPVCFDKSGQPGAGLAAILGCLDLSFQPCHPPAQWADDATPLILDHLCRFAADPNIEGRTHHHRALLDVEHILERERKVGCIQRDLGYLNSSPP